MKKCCNCENEVDINGDCGWSSTQDDYLCLWCRDNDESSLSTIYIANGDLVNKYFVGEHIRVNEKGEEIDNSVLAVKREWVSTSAHRGHYETTIDGWTEMLNGWTTASWGDDISDKKQVFNEWAENVISCNIFPPTPIAIVVDPTSNLFSTGISVLTKEPDKLEIWLSDVYEELSESLS